MGRILLTCMEMEIDPLNPHVVDRSAMNRQPKIYYPLSTIFLLELLPEVSPINYDFYWLTASLTISKCSIKAYYWQLCSL